MKSFLYYLNLFLDEAVKSTKGKLYIAPALLAAISAATTIGTKIASDIKAKKLAEKADREAAAAKALEEKKANATVAVARGIAKEGDPTLAAKKREIQKSAADAIGKTVASSGSTQEVINAAQAIQSNKDKANILANSQASQYKLNAKKFLADRFTAAGQLRLAGNAAIDQRLRAALEAIGANAQSNVDTAQNLGSQFVQAVGTLSGGGN